MNLKPIGYFSKSHGLKGHLILFTEFDFDESLNVLFIENKGSHAPFFIEEFSEFNKGFMVKLEGINTIDLANGLKNKTVLADENLILQEEEFEFAGYSLIDEVKGEIGTIDGLTGGEINPVLRLFINGKEVLLPFKDEFVIKIDHSAKKMFFKAPDGLIDMYLED